MFRRCEICLKSCSIVSIVDFENEIVCWVTILARNELKGLEN